MRLGLVVGWQARRRGIIARSSTSLPSVLERSSRESDAWNNILERRWAGHRWLSAGAGGRGAAPNRGTTPCNYPCTGHPNAERERGAQARAERQRWATAVVAYMEVNRPGRRRAIRTPSSTAAIPPKRLRAGARCAPFWRSNPGDAED
jgi:hypothetical protein